MKKKIKDEQDLKRIIDTKVVDIFDSVDKEIEKKNTKNIVIDIERKFDLVNKYSDKKVCKDLIEFLIDRIDDFKPSANVKIFINKNKNIEESATKLIREGLKVEHKNNLKERDESNLKQLWLLCMGLILIFLSSKVPDAIMWKEVLLIVGWVPIWETMEIELFPDAVARKRRKSIKRLLKCEMVERKVDKEGVDSIEVSKGEELVERR